MAKIVLAACHANMVDKYSDIVTIEKLMSGLYIYAAKKAIQNALIIR